MRPSIHQALAAVAVLAAALPLRAESPRVDPGSFDPRTFDPPRLAPQSLDPRTLDPKTLESGEIIVQITPVKGSKTSRFESWGLIKAPPAAVWPHIDKCGDYAGKMPRSTISRELSRFGKATDPNGARVMCFLTVDMPWPMDDLSSSSRSHHLVTPGRWLRTYELHEGDYDYSRGAWMLTPWGKDGKATLTYYTLHTSPKTSVPGFIRRAAQKKSLPGVIRAIRKVVTGEE